MEAYLASVANHTNRKMLAKLRFFNLFIYLFLLFIYLFIYSLIYLFIYLSIVRGEKQHHISFPSICNVMACLTKVVFS